EAVKTLLEAGKPARLYQPSEELLPAYKALNLLTSKPVLYAANVREEEAATGNALVEQLKAAIAQDGENASVVVFSAQVEAELSELEAAERQEFLSALGLSESGLDRLARAAYGLL